MAAARVLIWARLRSSLIASHLLAVDLFTERAVVTASGPSVLPTAAAPAVAE
jgi:hypothetical protein